MRISTQVLYQRSTESMLTQQTKLSQQNVHFTAEKRVLYGSDDASAISTIQSLKETLSKGEQYLENGKRTKTANQLESTALEQVTTIMQSIREKLVTAGNGTYDAKARGALATELEGLREQLMGVANTKDSNNQYIFSGFELDTQPFQSNEFGTVDYHGDDGQRSYQVGSGASVKGNDPGSAVFINIAEGNGNFVSEGNSNNTGSGVIDEASIIDGKKAKPFLDEDYTISISESAAGEAQYSVYGLKESSVSGNAKVKVSQIDRDDANIANVDPALNGKVNIEFIATATAGQFEVQINGESSLPVVYDSTNTNSQAISIDGVSIEVDGIPNAGDQYALTKYAEPTQYNEGQSIEFNGIKTELKGDVKNLDSFTLRQSEEKDIFSTIQDSIEALRIPGEDDAADAQRQMRLDTSRLQVDNAMSNISTVVTAVGLRLNTIDSQNSSVQDFNLASKTMLSSLEDLDMVSAASDIKMQQDVLELTQQTFVKMQSLNLFQQM